jgi:hypothetical protein
MDIHLRCLSTQFYDAWHKNSAILDYWRALDIPRKSRPEICAFASIPLLHCSIGIAPLWTWGERRPFLFRSVFGGKL